MFYGRVDWKLRLLSTFLSSLYKNINDSMLLCHLCYLERNYLNSFYLSEGAMRIDEILGRKFRKLSNTKLQKGREIP